MRGLSDEYGSWKITWILRRTSRMLGVAGSAAMSAPPKRSSPRSARRAEDARPTVVLPQPDSPTRPERLARHDVKRDVVDRLHDRGLAERNRPGAFTAKYLLQSGRRRAAARRLRRRQLPRCRRRIACATRACRRRSLRARMQADEAAGVDRARARLAARRPRCGRDSAARSGSPAARAQVRRQAFDGFELRCRAARSSRGTERIRPIV